MRQVEKYIKLYQAGKVTPHQVYKRLGSRKYKEWYDKLYNWANWQCGGFFDLAYKEHAGHCKRYVLYKHRAGWVEVGKC